MYALVQLNDGSREVRKTAEIGNNPLSKVLLVNDNAALLYSLKSTNNMLVKIVPMTTESSTVNDADLYGKKAFNVDILPRSRSVSPQLYPKSTISHLKLSTVKRKLFDDENIDLSQPARSGDSLELDHDTGSLSERDPFEDSGSEYVPDSSEKKNVSSDSEIDVPAKWWADENSLTTGSPHLNASPGLSKTVINPVSLEQNKEKQMQKKKKQAPCKYHCCYFCGKLYTNLRKHWRNKHDSEPEFQSALQASEKMGQHHRAFDKLRKLGDEKYNKSVTVPIVVRKSNIRDESQYIICVRCKGYFLSKNYTRHRKLACSKLDSEGKNLTGTSRVATCRISEEAHPLLKEKIFPFFVKEAQRKILFYDPIAIIFGNVLVSEQLMKPDPADLYKYVSHQLRLLADLLIIAKSKDDSVKEIDDMLYPSRYTLLVECIKTRGNYKDGVYQNPYPAMQSCTILSKVCSKLKSMALAEGKMDLFQRYERVGMLLKDQQNTDITKLAAASRISHRRKKIEVIPTTAEVKKLFEVLELEFKEAFVAAKRQLTAHTYSILAQVIAARIMVMNRRRPGDICKTTLTEYKNLSTVGEDFLSSLTNESERKLAMNFCRYVTRGKLNKTTSNLITRDMVDAIDYLISNRSNVGIDDNDIYLFANPKAKRAPFFRPDLALKLICERRGLNSDKYQATKLRKHFATATSKMDQVTQKLVSDFMGHSYKIHENIYQISQVQTDISVIGRLLFDASGIYQTNAPLTFEVTSQNQKEDYTNEANSVLEEEAAIQEDPVIAEKPENHRCSSFEDQITNTTLIDKDCKQKHKRRKQTKKVSFEASTSCTNQDEMVEKSDKTKGFSLSIGSYKSVKYPQVSSSVTWRTPQKALARTVFEDYLQDEVVPPLSTIQDELVQQNASFGKTLLQIQCWIRAEIFRRSRKGTAPSRKGWTTPQKVKLRHHFAKYYARTKETGKMIYPPQRELIEAVRTIPEFSSKSAPLLRSKLQHEYSTWSLIEKCQRMHGISNN